ncbi:MAG: 1-(5-phosphoribosyl)-5-[(5-phosphoribosylamino)methylideneamino] imidazole-4-carboxamide isomerase [Steroidobacteraceae bacterium]|nr:1-(5-phosphoribosyl)-5-[(5-phosphoribosylamino)methylideneamino] imidazole-4-carboxamide isomerase [Steroidobacteraceae bacterium]
MELIPAIDLKGGRVVRLFQGDFSAETRYEVTPAELYGRYVEAGARRLHIVDLDGARDGAVENRAIVRQLAGFGSLRVQCGGGLRSLAAVEALLAAGVERAVIGSVAVTDPGAVRDWFGRLGSDRLVLALDVRIDAHGEPQVTTHGWTESSGLSLWDAVAGFVPSGLTHVLCTDVARDGALAGPNLDLYREAVARFPGIAWQASGGVRDAQDLHALDRVGVAAAVSGKALIEGRIQPEELVPFLPAA